MEFHGEHSTMNQKVKFLHIIFALLLTLTTIIFLRITFGTSNDSNKKEKFQHNFAFAEPKGKFNIFFIETRSPKDGIGYFNARQTCVIESAAQLNPDWNIYVFVVDIITFLEDSYWEVLESLSNVHVIAIETKRFTKGTPTEKLLQKELPTRSNWKIAHLSDVLRYTTLFKYAGVYMDLDMISLKNLDKNVSNFAGLHEPKLEILVGAGIVGFSDDEIGRKLAENVVRDVADHYVGNDWADNSVGKLTRAVQKLCNTTFVDLAYLNGCHGFKLYSHEYFYAIPWFLDRAFFETQYYEYGMLKIRNSIGTHLWNFLSAEKKAQKGSQTVICEIARNFCPKTNDIESEFCL